MKIRLSFLNTCFLGFSLLFSGELAMADLSSVVCPVRKVTIIGGGIAGALESPSPNLHIKIRRFMDFMVEVADRLKTDQ